MTMTASSVAYSNPRSLDAPHRSLSYFLTQSQDATTSSAASHCFLEALPEILHTLLHDKPVFLSLILQGSQKFSVVKSIISNLMLKVEG